MAELLTPTDIKRLAAKRGLTLASVCSQAGIAVSTFSRWQAGKTEPSIAVYRRLVDVVGADEGETTAGRYSTPQPIEAV